MSTTHALSALAVSFTLVTFGAAPAIAHPAPADPPAAAAASTAQDDDTDETFHPAEPDYRLINLPTTMRLPLFKGNFDLTHRFAGNLRDGSSFGEHAETLFGIDEGATVGFEYRIAVARHLEAAVFRTAYARTIQMYAKYDAIHQHGSRPLSASLVVSIEGEDNFKEHYAPAVGLSLSRQIADRVALYVVPTFVHNANPLGVLGLDNDVFFVGLGGRVRIASEVYIAAEVSPPVGSSILGTPEFGFALERRAGGHMFQFNVTNTFGTTLAQIARGGAAQNLQLGFNLSRKFF